MVATRSEGTRESSSGRRRLALSTGQAARFCFVTPDTIVNWIKSGLLPAQRTAGGQYRILVADLRAFMVARDMSTAFLDEEQGVRTLCWQYRAEQRGRSSADSPCRDCIVRFLGVLDCFKLMGMRPGAGRPRRDCADCEYYRRWGVPPSPDGEGRPSPHPRSEEVG